MASGNTLLQWPASAGIPPSTSFATLARRNNHLVANFDAAADESLDFEGVLPANYAGGGLTVTLVWLAATATSGDVVWNVDIERHEDDVTDLDADSFVGVNAATGTAASATGEPQYTAVTFTNGADMDSLAVGESFRLRVTRDADNGSDTMAGDAQLLRVVVSET
jgi:hypothetical protein